jgi:hypothetical protein
MASGVLPALVTGYSVRQHYRVRALIRSLQPYKDGPHGGLCSVTGAPLPLLTKRHDCNSIHCRTCIQKLCIVLIYGSSCTRPACDRPRKLSTSQAERQRTHVTCFVNHLLSIDCAMRLMVLLCGATS